MKTRKPQLPVCNGWLPPRRRKPTPAEIEAAKPEESDD
jgi:hypothetical protein